MKKHAASDLKASALREALPNKAGCPGDDWLREAQGAVRLAVHLQPGASRNAIEAVSNGRLRIRVQAPPVEGAANEALCKLLSKTLGVAKSKVRIAHGETSREKTVEISGLSGDDARAILSGIIAGQK